MLRYVFIGTGVVLVAVILCAVFLERRISFPDATSQYVRHDRSSEGQRNPLDANHLETRGLVGSVIMLGKDNAYIRLSVKGEAIYSIGITADTRITRNGEKVDISTIEPFAQVSVVARVLSQTKTNLYDFLAESMDIAVPKEKTIEERKADLSELSRMMNTKP